MRNLRSEIDSEAGEASLFYRINSRHCSRRPGVLSLSKLGLCLTALALPLASGAADPPDALQVLKSAAAAYQSLYNSPVEVTVQTIDGAKVAQSRYSETGAGKSFRSEDEDSRGLLRISNGEHVWTLDRGANEYTETSVGSTAPCFIAQLAKLDQNVRTATVDDEETYSPGGNSVDVYIVEVTRTLWPADSPEGAQSETYTIDAKTFEVYKATTYATEAAQVIYFSLTQQNPPPLQSFTFTPPAGAKQVDALPRHEPAYKSIIGTEAPDFTLKDSLGHRYSLHDFRGKVVAIDFIGAWCPPCMAQAPYMQQVNDAYLPRDLEVFGLDVGESTKVVGELTFNAQFTFPILVGAEPDVTEKYFVGDFPTVYIIGRDGRIAFKATGTDNPGGFLAAVKDAVAKKN
jgi:peroxiredoxin/outer membrane lipoprotein-sorting protein